MSVLEDLFYDNINPNEMRFDKETEYERDDEDGISYKITPLSAVNVPSATLRFNTSVVAFDKIQIR